MVILYFIKLNAILDAVTCSAIKMQSDRACADGKSLVARLNTLAPGRAPSVVRSAHAARIVSVLLCFFAYALELFLEAGEIFVGKFFQIDKFISSPFQRSDYFVEFQMSRFGIAVLRILNEKDHQESNNCRSGINNELPGIGVMKRGTD